MSQTRYKKSQIITFMTKAFATVDVDDWIKENGMSFSEEQRVRLIEVQANAIRPQMYKAFQAIEELNLLTQHIIHDEEIEPKQGFNANKDLN